MWASSRKLIYALLFLFMLVALGVYGFRSTLFPTPTCNDNKQNGYEEGVDCGGLCSRRCISQVIPIQVLWARALPVSYGVYDLVGMVSNHNIDSAPFTFGVTFTVYDSNANIIYKNTSPSIVPTTGDIPVLLQNIKLPVAPERVVLTLEEGTSYKTPQAFQSVQIAVTNTSFENTNVGRAYVTIHNLTRTRFLNFPVRVVLYDANQNAVATGQTFVESLDKDADKIVSFTWNDRFAVKPVLIKAYPILSPF